MIPLTTARSESSGGLPFRLIPFGRKQKVLLRLTREDLGQVFAPEAPDSSRWGWWERGGAAKARGLKEPHSGPFLPQVSGGMKMGPEKARALRRSLP